jgi:lysozyme
VKVGEAGVSLIKSFEGFVGHPYRDEVGVWTIGYGHTEGVGPNSRHLTEPQASKLLKEDLDKRYAPYVNALGLPLTQNQFDALVSFVYNVGPGGIATSSHAGRALRALEWLSAADHLLDWDMAGGRVSEGLRRRRVAERALFLRQVNPLAGFLPNEQRWIAEYDRLRRSNSGPVRQRVLRRVMTEERKRIWVAAQGEGGWSTAHRLVRYRALLARTT